MKNILAVVLMLALCSPGFAEERIVENPARPSNPKAGRVVTAKEVLRIEDTGDAFYFKMPRNIQAGDDGGLVIQDGQQQLLSFGPDGQFRKNYFKPGQGPEELTHILNFVRTVGGIVIFGMPPKILRLDSNGRVVEEIGLAQTTSLNHIIDFRDGLYYFIKREPPKNDGVNGWIDFPQTIVAISDEGKSQVELASFPIPIYLQWMAGGVHSETAFNELMITPFGSSEWVLTHQREYFVKIFDPREKQVRVSFRRPYRRVRRSGGMGGVSSSGGAGPTPPEFINDITGLHTLGDRILVQTSTVDRKKGYLFDVYDREGRYIDAFFLKTTAEDLDARSLYRSFTFAGSFVYFFERTPEDTYVLKKCTLDGL